MVPSRPRRKDTGQPWRLPESVVRGVLMSEWASTCCQLVGEDASGCAAGGNRSRGVRPCQCHLPTES